MRLATKIKLSASLQQKSSLKETLERCSDACNFVSSIVYSSGNSSFIDLQKLLYYDIKEDFSLSAQMTLLCLNKTANDYHNPRFCERHYRKNSAIPFDDRVLTFYPNKKEISIWTVNGRIKISFLCGEQQIALLEKRIGQSDLVFENNEFFLLVGYEEKEKILIEPQDFLGVDLGIKKLAVDSEKEMFTGERVEKKRKQFARHRRYLQKRKSKNAKRALCKLRKKEKNYKQTQNHEIAKKLVLKAKGTQLGIALEELTGIREGTTVRKKNRNMLTSWSFGQLRGYIEYKAKLHGVVVELVDPKNTSRRCPKCGYTNKKNRKSQAEFCCGQCGYFENADYVGALNIRQKARISYGWDAIRSEKAQSSGLSQSISASALLKRLELQLKLSPLGESS